ncbi:hypothetical protein ACL6C3_05535 [Capilliphycus salinus ALCB114379]|uniref:hypothetical protein n=1 Tax=Capilliphycus salinus TaxID=2768948 RepID=UPI0039A5764A
MGSKHIAVNRLNLAEFPENRSDRTCSTSTIRERLDVQTKGKPPQMYPTSGEFHRLEPRFAKTDR